nr:hypothetical protein SEVIR_3G322403v2 [Setaria viridis]
MLQSFISATPLGSDVVPCTTIILLPSVFSFAGWFPFDSDVFEVSYELGSGR